MSCGTGQRRRFRSCLSPLTTADSRPCVGVGQQTDVCNQHHCPGETDTPSPAVQLVASETTSSMAVFYFAKILLVNL